KMAVQFTRLGKEIAIAVKEGGPHPENNSRLRTAIQNAKAVNMPKDRVEAAIKRASEKDSKGYEEFVYEGYGPHGVPVLIETATDISSRTVATIRSYFTTSYGSLRKTVTLDFIFDRKSIFRFAAAEDLDVEELELELVDGGLEELYVEADEEGNDIVVVQTSFEDFGNMQRLLEEIGRAHV